MTIAETDFYIREADTEYSNESTITFKYGAEGKEPFPQYKHDWYILVALAKADLVIQDRHLLTRELLLNYRWCIREGYQHMLDGNLRSPWSHPRNKNTIAGIQGYIDKIVKRKEDRAS